MLIGGTATLAARHLGVAQDLLGDEAAAVDTLRRAIAVGRELRADARGRPRPDRPRGDPAAAGRPSGRVRAARRGGQLPSAELGMEPEATRAAQLSGTDTSETPVEPIARERATSIILFTDIVDSTRLTEELGAGHYRARARLAERAITGAIVAHGGTVVTGISLGDGFIGLFPTVGQALDAARGCVGRREHDRPAPPRRGAPGRAHRRRRPHLRRRGQHGGAGVRVERARRDPGVDADPRRVRRPSPTCASSTAASTCSRASPRRSACSRWSTRRNAGRCVA